jgi:phage FluMu protein Com
MQFEFRAKCPQCKTTRAIFGPREGSTPEQLDAIEAEIDRCGGVIAKCPSCNCVEWVAMFVDNKQAETWQGATEYEADNGSGELPPKPWEPSNE